MIILSAAFLLTCCARASGNAPASVSATDSPVVKVGIEVLVSRGFDGLAGKRVGLVTNPSGVDRNLRSIDPECSRPAFKTVRPEKDL